MTEKVIFYQLTHKFVNHDQAIPEGPRQVIYYSLAIGHHVGVMDCLQSVLEIPVDQYKAWISNLPEGSARHKLEGAIKWGEIEINDSHAALLSDALRQNMKFMAVAAAAWTQTLLEQLELMRREPAIYLMVRRSP